MSQKEIPLPLTLKQISRRYKFEDYYSEAYDRTTTPASIILVHSKVRIKDNQIVYVKPKSIKEIKSEKIPPDAEIHRIEEPKSLA